MFKRKCKCGATEKNFKMDIGDFFVNECCEKAGYDHLGNKVEDEEVVPSSGVGNETDENVGNEEMSREPGDSTEPSSSIELTEEESELADQLIEEDEKDEVNTQLDRSVGEERERLSKMTTKQLRALADERNLGPLKYKKKAELVEILLKG